jgi:transposase
LAIALRPAAQGWTVPNDKPDMTSLVEHWRARGPTLRVLEATSGLELPVTGALATAGCPVAVVNPRQARDVATATGRVAKTDGLDARALAHVAEAVRPIPRPLPEAHAQALSTLLMRRRQRMEMLTAENNRLRAAPAGLRPRRQVPIQWREHELHDLDTDIGSRSDHRRYCVV